MTNNNSTLVENSNNTNYAEQKSAFIAIIGAPNAGKSTLLNQIAGQKISIVTHKVQTTRENIRAIHSDKKSGAQLVFTDTPGIFSPNRQMERHIVQNAMNSIDENDILLVIIDASLGLNDYLKQTLEQIVEQKNITNIFAVINKIDLIDKPQQFELVDTLLGTKLFKECFAISALKGFMVSKMVDHLQKFAKPMPWIYDPSLPTDSNIRTMAEEITREKIFLHLHRELPYSIKIETDSWDETDKMVIIYQSIYLLKSSQKKILLGKGGQKIKTIGTAARKEIAELIGKKVNLFLHAKIREDWMDKEF